MDCHSCVDVRNVAQWNSGITLLELPWNKEPGTLDQARVCEWLLFDFDKCKESGS